MGDTGITDFQLPPDILKSVVADPTVSGATAKATDAMDILDQTLLKTQSNNIQTTTNLMQSNNAVVQQLVKQGDAQRAALDSVAAQRENVDRLPNVITNIMGIFDSDYNKAVLADREQRARLGLQATGAQMENISHLTQTQLDIIANNQKSAELQYKVTGARLDRALELRKTIENEAISQEERRIRLAGEARAQAGEKRTKIMFEQEQRDYKLHSMDDAALDAAAKSGDTTTGITSFQAQSEQIRRAKEKLDLKSIVQATDAGEISLAETRKNLFLSSQNQQTIKNLRDVAVANGGSVSYNGVEFTVRDIDKALTTIAGEDKAANQAAADLAVKQSMTGSYIDNASDTVIKFSQTVGSSTPISGPMTALDRANREAQIRAKAGDWDGAYEAAKKGNEEVTKFVDDYVKSLPELQQPYVRQRINGMPVTNVSDVHNYLGVAALDSQALGPTDASGTTFNATPDAKYGKSFQLFSSKLNELLLGAGGPMAGRFGGKKDTDALLQSIINGDNKDIKLDKLSAMAFGQSGAAIAWMGERNVTAVQDALAQLGKMQPQVFGNMSTGMFVVQGGDGKGAFDSNLMLTRLRQKWEYDQKQLTGKGGPGGTGAPGASVPYDQQLLEYMGSDTFQQRIHDHWTAGNSPIGSAMLNLIAKDNPLVGWNDSLNAMRDGFNQYYTQIQKDTAQSMQMLQQYSDPLSGFQAGAN